MLTLVLRPTMTALCHYIPPHSYTLVQAHWTLQTYLKLPWRPFINVIGATEYSLNAEANQVCVPTTKLVVLIDLLQCIYTGHAQSSSGLIKIHDGGSKMHDGGSDW